MKLKNCLKAILIIGLISCKQEPTKKEIALIKESIVVNADDKIAFIKFRELNLDSTYTNLLDPRNVTESEYKAVTQSWSKFHKKIDEFIKEKNFKWEVTDSTISIINRIYFTKDGSIEYYAFKILNPSISYKKRTEFEKILENFSKETKLELKRNEPYAQCGKIKYLNYQLSEQ